MISSSLNGTTDITRERTIRKRSSLTYERPTGSQPELALARFDSPRTCCADGHHGCRSPPTSNHFGHVKMTSSGVQDCTVDRMPPEILGIIFENCLPENGLIRPVLSEPPLLLGRVCSHWRSLSRNTPKLWTSLTFRFLETHIDRSHDGPRVSSAFHTWLHHSSPLPLSISFTDNRIFQKDTEEVIIWLLLQIRAHAPRWKDIHLQFSSDYFIQLSALSPCKFTSLESFSVHTDHMGWRRGLISINLDLTHARNLTSLSYTGPDRVVREDLLVNWTRLTSISFQYDLHEAGGESSTFPRHFLALSLCENLVELSIGLGAISPRYIPTSDTRIYLPRLDTLRVRRLSRSAHACTLIDAFVLPHLTSLTVDSALLVGWDGWNTHWHDAQFSALIRRSGCQLRALHVRDVDFPMEELARCLEGAEGLKSLVFVPCPRAQPIGELLDRLSVGRAMGKEGVGRAGGVGVGVGVREGGLPGGETSRFRELERICIGCAHEAYFAPLAEMVEGRSGKAALQAGVTPLAAFELVFYDFVHDSHPLRKPYFDMFKKRLLRCAEEDGRMDVVVRVERPYEPAYISLPSDPAYGKESLQRVA